MFTQPKVSWPARHESKILFSHNYGCQWLSSTENLVTAREWLFLADSVDIASLAAAPWLPQLQRRLTQINKLTTVPAGGHIWSRWRFLLFQDHLRMSSRANLRAIIVRIIKFKLVSIKIHDYLGRNYGPGTEFMPTDRDPPCCQHWHFPPTLCSDRICTAWCSTSSRWRRPELRGRCRVYQLEIQISWNWRHKPANSIRIDGFHRCKRVIHSCCVAHLAVRLSTGKKPGNNCTVQFSDLRARWFQYSCWEQRRQQCLQTARSAGEIVFNMSMVLLTLVVGCSRPYIYHIFSRRSDCHWTEGGPSRHHIGSELHHMEDQFYESSTDRVSEGHPRQETSQSNSLSTGVERFTTLCRHSRSG